MQVVDLGPLERAVLKALVLAEAFDAPASLPVLHRTLPRYDTHLANVRAALAEGAPLRAFVAHHLGHYALRDREALLHGLGAAQGRANRVWDELKGTLRGMCKLPFLEAVAVAGAPARGVVPEGPDADVLPLVVIAEGGRVRLARAAVAAYRRARGDAGRRLRVETILDADSLARPAGSRWEALRWLSLRPAMNEAGWTAFQQANPWIETEFPSAGSDAGGLLDCAVGAGRFDGRLARLRRRVVASPTSAGTRPLLQSVGRRASAWTAAEEALQAGLRGDGVECPLPRMSAEELDARFEARWAELQSWELPGRAVAAPTPVLVEIDRDVPPVPPARSDEAPPTEAAAPAPPRRPVTSRAPARRTAPAAPSASGPATGRRTRGSGRKRS